MNDGPIVIVEDDLDDQSLITEAVNGLPVNNQLLFFEEGNLALHYLYTTEDKPFIILSDINLPGMNGAEFRMRIQQDEYLRKKSIPFLFFSTAATKKLVEEAYELSVQGFFIKPNDFNVLRETLWMIIVYWKNCIHRQNI